MSANYYVGVDLHKQTFDFVVMDDSGVVVEQKRLSTNEGKVGIFASQLTRNHHLVVEPLINTYWFLDQVTPFVGSVHIAHPYKVRLIAQSRTKSDRSDARVLADLLRLGYLPESYNPPREILVVRHLVSHRHRLVCDRTRVKNRVHKLLAREGVQIPARDAFGKRGRGILDSLELREETRFQMDDLLSDHDFISSRIKAVEDRLAGLEGYDDTLELLQTIPGISFISAISIVGIVGDIHRFRNVGAFARFTGLTPGYRDSGARQRSTGITHEGNRTLRWLLIQAERHLRRKCIYADRLYKRIVFKDCVQVAKTAVAHRMARVIYHVWTEERPFYATA